jgi:hypothetical protein
MNILYDNLINRSIILDKLSINLLISNVIIIKNDPVNKYNKLIKDYNGKKDYETIENIIEQTSKYKEHVVNLKKYFNDVFTRAKQKKNIINVDKNITDICAKCK